MMYVYRNVNRKQIYYCEVESKCYKNRKKNLKFHQINRLTSIAALLSIQKYGCLTLFYTNSQTNVLRKLRFQQKYRQTERQIIANALCTKDYRVVILQLQISHAGQNEKMDKLRYRSIAKSIVHQAFRQLERFLLQHCQRKINRLTKNQLEAISKYLLDPRSLLSFDQAVTFGAFIRIIFGFCSITMSEYYAAQLYSTLMHILLQRIKKNQVQPDLPEPYRPPIAPKAAIEELLPKSTAKYSETRELNQQWNSAFEQLLIEQVKYDQNHFVQIPQSFKIKFPQSKHLFTVQSLRNRFYRLLRTAIKKFKAIVNTYRDRLPQMVLLDDDRAREIITCRAGAQLKLQFIRIYEMSEAKVDLEFIASTIERVNQFVITREKDCTYTPKEVAEDKWGYEIDYKDLSELSKDSP